jgi:hypothetical protein
MEHIVPLIQKMRALAARGHAVAAGLASRVGFSRAVRPGVDPGAWVRIPRDRHAGPAENPDTFLAERDVAQGSALEAGLCGDRSHELSAAEAPCGLCRHLIRRFASGARRWRALAEARPFSGVTRRAPSTQHVRRPPPFICAADSGSAPFGTAPLEGHVAHSWTNANALVIDVERACEQLSLSGVASAEQAIARIEEHLRGRQAASARPHALPPGLL